jgi:very-short-patch-repair endonuclease
VIVSGNKFFLDIADPSTHKYLEVDGWTHDIPSRKINDVRRDNLLQDNGWAALRVREEEISSKSHEISCFFETTGKLPQERPASY